MKLLLGLRKELIHGFAPAEHVSHGLFLLRFLLYQMNGHMFDLLCPLSAVGRGRPLCLRNGDVHNLFRTPLDSK